MGKGWKICLAFTVFISSSNCLTSMSHGLRYPCLACVFCAVIVVGVSTPPVPEIPDVVTIDDVIGDALPPYIQVADDVVEVDPMVSEETFLNYRWCCRMTMNGQRRFVLVCEKYGATVQYSPMKSRKKSCSNFRRVPGKSLQCMTHVQPCIHLAKNKTKVIVTFTRFHRRAL